MIRAVTVTNYLGESKRFELAFPEKSGFAVQSISGFGPSKADINTTEISTNDGSLYNSARVNSRNIVMSLKLMFNPQIEDTRHDSYKYFPIKKKVTLLIETDNRICETYGYVESNEPDIFSSDETTQISIVCPDPYFYSAGPDGTNTTIFYGCLLYTSKGSAGLVVFAAAIRVLVGAVEDLGALDVGSLAKGLIGVGVLCTELALFLKATDLDGMGVLKGTGLVLLAASINILANAVGAFGALDISSLLKGLSAVAVVLTELAVFTKVTANAKHVVSTATAMTILGAAMLVFGEAVKKMGNLTCLLYTSRLWGKPISLKIKMMTILKEEIPR